MSGLVNASFSEAILLQPCNLNFHLSFAFLSQVADIEANTIAVVGQALSWVNWPTNFLKS